MSSKSKRKPPVVPDVEVPSLIVPTPEPVKPFITVTLDSYDINDEGFADNFVFTFDTNEGMDTSIIPELLTIAANGLRQQQETNNSEDIPTIVEPDEIYSADGRVVG